MKFRTIIDIPPGFPPIHHNDALMLMGSCFAENMGNRLLDAKFTLDKNPYGILYNPASIAQALREIMGEQPYTSHHIFSHQGLYQSYMHHGIFSDTNEAACLRKINERLASAHHSLPTINYLFITFGTAWIYTLKSDGRIVANCHKMPARDFVRSRLSVEQITEAYSTLIADISRLNPQIKFIFTVSPVRHIKDGLHENQLSKATLLLSVARLQERFAKQVFYFPAYEIVVDELRDYRFYATDMLHPSDLATDYIWERLSDAAFNAETQTTIKEIESISRDINHRPFNPDTEAHKRFLEQLVLKINRLKEKCPTLDLQNELDLCLTQLNK